MVMRKAQPEAPVRVPAMVPITTGMIEVWEVWEVWERRRNQSTNINKLTAMVVKRKRETLRHPLHRRNTHPMQPSEHMLTRVVLMMKKMDNLQRGEQSKRKMILNQWGKCFRSFRKKKGLSPYSKVCHITSALPFFFLISFLSPSHSKVLYFSYSKTKNCECNRGRQKCYYSWGDWIWQDYTYDLHPLNFPSIHFP